jgi:hypothetical protein
LSFTVQWLFIAGWTYIAGWLFTTGTLHCRVCCSSQGFYLCLCVLFLPSVMKHASYFFIELGSTKVMCLWLIDTCILNTKEPLNMFYGELVHMHVFCRYKYMFSSLPRYNHNMFLYDHVNNVANHLYQIIAWLQCRAKWGIHNVNIVFVHILALLQQCTTKQQVNLIYSENKNPRVLNNILIGYELACLVYVDTVDIFIQVLLYEI